MDPRVEQWLIAKARHLRSDTRGAYDLSGLLKRLAISLVVETTPTHTGLLARRPDGTWVVIARGPRALGGLSPIHRYTIAHEIAHYFLQTEWNYSPSIDDHRAYFACETACNKFASYLLIDHDVVSATEVEHPQSLLLLIRRFAQVYAVSAESMSRAFIEHHKGFLVCGIVKDPNNTWKRLWCVSSLTEVKRIGVRKEVSDPMLELIRCCRLMLGTGVGQESLVLAEECQTELSPPVSNPRRALCLVGAKLKPPTCRQLEVGE